MTKDKKKGDSTGNSTGDKALVRYLSDWLIRFFKNKDLIFRKIVNIDSSDGEILVEYKDKKNAFIVDPFIHQKDFEELHKLIEKGGKNLVTLNTRYNFDMILKNWQKLLKNPHFCIYFLNPLSLTEKKWVIFPRTHDLISDPSTLVSGLQTLFNTVQEIDEKELLEVIEKSE